MCDPWWGGPGYLACIHLVTGSSLSGWVVLWGGPFSSPGRAVGVPWCMTQFPHTPPLVLSWRLRFGVVMTEEKGWERGHLHWGVGCTRAGKHM